MSWISKTFGILVVGLTLAAPMATPLMAGQVVIVHRPVVRSRIVAVPRATVRPHVVVPSYAPFGWYGYGYYGPAWGYPAYPVYAVRPDTGEVKIDTKMKDASLYVDGGYVGPVGKFRKFSLKPGNHDIELRDAYGGILFDRRVQVIVGKSVQLRPFS